MSTLLHCDEGQHNFRFLRQETRYTSPLPARTTIEDVRNLGSRTVDIFYCTRCLKHEEVVVRETEAKS